MQPIAIVLQRDNCLIEMGAKWNGGTNAFHEMLAGEPDVGNPQVRFDEGEQWNRHLRHPLFSTLLESQSWLRSSLNEDFRLLTADFRSSAISNQQSAISNQQS